MTNPVKLTTQPTGNASGQTFPFSFAQDSANNNYLAQVSVNTSFAAIDPATDESVQQCATSLASIATSTSTLSTNSGACTITQTIVPLAANATYTIAANAVRKSLLWMVTGPGALAVCPGTTAPTSSLGGIVFDGANTPPGQAAVAGWQGGSQEYDGPSVPTNAFSFLAFQGETNLIIWEGA